MGGTATPAQPAATYRLAVSTAAGTAYTSGTGNIRYPASPTTTVTTRGTRPNHRRSVAGGSTRFFAEIQACYEWYDPATPPGLRLSDAADIPRDGELTGSGRFAPGDDTAPPAGSAAGDTMTRFTQISPEGRACPGWPAAPWPGRGGRRR